jgi:hypothetical protein
LHSQLTLLCKKTTSIMLTESISRFTVPYEYQSVPYRTGTIPYRTGTISYHPGKNPYRTGTDSVPYGVPIEFIIFESRQYGAHQYITVNNKMLWCKTRLLIGP